MTAERGTGRGGIDLVDRRQPEADRDAAQDMPMALKHIRQSRRKRFTAIDFARWGRQGGAIRAARMTAQARHDSARRAGLKRWDGIGAVARSEHARKAVAARWRKRKGGAG